MPTHDAIQNQINQLEREAEQLLSKYHAVKLEFQELLLAAEKMCQSQTVPNYVNLRKVVEKHRRPIDSNSAKG